MTPYSSIKQTIGSILREKREESLRKEKELADEKLRVAKDFFYAHKEDMKKAVFNRINKHFTDLKFSIPLSIARNGFIFYRDFMEMDDIDFGMMNSIINLCQSDIIELAKDICREEELSFEEEWDKIIIGRYDL